MKRWRLAAAAAVSVAAAGCADRPLGVGEPGNEAIVDAGQGAFDLSSAPDLSHQGPPPSGTDYGPAITFSDLSSPADGGAD